MDGTNINSTKAENFLFLHNRTFVLQSDKNTEIFVKVRIAELYVVIGWNISRRLHWLSGALAYKST